MVGFMEPFLDILNRQIGRKTDGPNASGTLHAKLASIIQSGSGALVIKSIQRGTIVLSSSQTTNTGSISAVIRSKSVTNFLGASSSGDFSLSGDPYYAEHANTGHHFVRLALTDINTITATRAQHNGKELTVSYEVIEYY